MAELREGQEIRVRAVLKTKAGHTAAYGTGSASWESNAPEIATVRADPDDELTGIVKGVDGSNNDSATITCRVDGDPDSDQVRDIVIAGTVTVTRGEAVIGELDFGTATDVADTASGAGDTGTGTTASGTGEDLSNPSGTSTTGTETSGVSDSGSGLGEEVPETSTGDISETLSGTENPGEFIPGTTPSNPEPFQDPANPATTDPGATTGEAEGSVDTRTDGGEPAPGDSGPTTGTTSVEGDTL